MTILEAIALGCIQGITEFLPVSSSGHLVLAQQLLHVQNFDTLFFDVCVHVGTLISIVLVLWKEILEILKNLWISLSRFEVREPFRQNEFFRLGIVLLIGTIPAGVVGLIFRDQVRDAFTDPKLVSMNLVITGLILFLTRLARPVEGRRLGLFGAFLVGCGQALAILPGISRTGTTMSAAMFLKVKPVQAARLSFLLALPVIAGAAIVETSFLTGQAGPIRALPVIVGTIVAAISGFAAIKLLLRITERGKFAFFSIYCLAVGVLGIIFI